MPRKIIVPRVVGLRPKNKQLKTYYQSVNCQLHIITEDTGVYGKISYKRKKNFLGLLKKDKKTFLQIRTQGMWAL